jgi:hypothetical protein
MNLTSFLFKFFSKIKILVSFSSYKKIWRNFTPPPTPTPRKKKEAKLVELTLQKQKFPNFFAVNSQNFARKKALTG